MRPIAAGCKPSQVPSCSPPFCWRQHTRPRSTPKPSSTPGDGQYARQFTNCRDNEGCLGKTGRSLMRRAMRWLSETD